MASQEIETLAQALARLPGLGPRSARRAVLWLVKRRETALVQLLETLTAVRGALVESGIEVQEASVMQRPKTLVPLDEDGAVKVMKLIDALEDLDDTDTVHANFDVEAESLERVAG